MRYSNRTLFLLGAIALIAACRVTGNIGNSAIVQRTQLQRADRLLKRQEYNRAIAICNRVLNNGSTDPELLRKAKLELARVYFETRQFEKTVSLYNESIDTNATAVKPEDVINYIDLLKRTGNINKAHAIALAFQNKIKDNQRFTNLAQSVDNYYAYYNTDTLRANAVDSLRLNMGGYQYGLALYKNDIVFLSNVLTKNSQSFYTNSKLYVVKSGGVEPFSNTLRGVLQVGPASFFDESEKVIYTSNRYEVKNDKVLALNNLNATQLLQAHYVQSTNSWSKPEAIRLSHNEQYSFLHPTVAPKGSRMYFASDMPGGYGGTDIYYSDWDGSANRWKAPVNMGPTVNTNGDELYPYLIGKKLLFSSNGQPGFGGLDIFMVNLTHPGDAAVHLPFPINTQFDDLNPVLDEKKELLYFTSDRSGAHENDHIYVMDLVKNPMPRLDMALLGKELPAVLAPDTAANFVANDPRRILVTPADSVHSYILSLPVMPNALEAQTQFISARPVIDYADNKPESTHKILSDTSLVLTDAPVVVDSGRLIASRMQQIGRNEGNNGNEYTKNDSANVANSVNGSIAGADGKGGVGNTTTGTVITGTSESLNAAAADTSNALYHTVQNLRKAMGIIYFDLNAISPQNNEMRKLDSVIQAWKVNPALTIVVDGHADIIGTERYNLALSRSRAVSIETYLASKGVEVAKIRINYYGSTRPILASGQYGFMPDKDLFIQMQGVNRRCEIKMTN